MLVGPAYETTLDRLTGHCCPLGGTHLRSPGVAADDYVSNSSSLPVGNTFFLNSSFNVSQ